MLAYVGTKSSGTWTGLSVPNQAEPALSQSWSNTECQHHLAGRLPPQTSLCRILALSDPLPRRCEHSRNSQTSTMSISRRATTSTTRCRCAFRNATRRAFRFLVAYTLAKNIGFPGGDIFGDVGGGGAARGIDTFNRKLEKSIVPSDQTHVLITSWSYDLPFGRGKHFLSGRRRCDECAGGWLGA